jgi:hypothetical protein
MKNLKELRVNRSSEFLSFGDYSCFRKSIVLLEYYELNFVKKQAVSALAYFMFLFHPLLAYKCWVGSQKSPLRLSITRKDYPTWQPSTLKHEYQPRNRNVQ